MKRYAVVFCLNEYEDARISPLRFARSDASLVMTMLVRSGFESPALLTGPDATRRGLQRCLKQIIDGCERGDEVVVHFSAHGFDRDGKAVVWPWDCEPDDINGALTVEDVVAWTRKDGVQRLFILDTCRSALEQGRGDEEAVMSDAFARHCSFLVEEAEQSEVDSPLQMLMACEVGKRAYELPKRKAGALTWSLWQHFEEFGEINFLRDLMAIRARVAAEQPGQQPWSVGMSSVVWRNLMGTQRGPRVEVVEPPLETAKPAVDRSSFNSVVPVLGRDWVVPGLGLELIWVEPGEFLMGSPENENEVGRRENERQHRVRISSGYWLGKYPVTQGEYEHVMGVNPSGFKEVGLRAPVESVSWDEAISFCWALNTEHLRSLPGDYVFGLPSEAEWEYACRAGSGSAYCFGNSRQKLSAYGWYGSYSGETTHEVGKLNGNGWGLHDMHGNVWEWCHDRYGEYEPGLAVNPLGPVGGDYRVSRGGCWYDLEWSCRSARRYAWQPDYRGYRLGFRLAVGARQ